MTKRCTRAYNNSEGIRMKKIIQTVLTVLLAVSLMGEDWNTIAKVILKLCY